MVRGIRFQLIAGYLVLLLLLGLALLMELGGAGTLRAALTHSGQAALPVGTLTASTAALDRITGATIAALALVAAAGALLLWRIERAIIAPLRRLTEATAEVGHGELARPIAVSGAAELAPLAGQVDWLRRRLAAARHSVEVRDKELEAQTTEHDAFLRAVAHDFKAPLISLQGMATILAEHHAVSLDAEAGLYVSRIGANARRMQTLLDDLLAIARLGRPQDGEEMTALAAVVDEVTEQLQHTLQLRGATVRVEGRLPTVRADPARLGQVFMNLIDNAVKYTPPDRVPMIQITALEHATECEIVVRDNGIGIPRDSCQRVLDAFQRLPDGKALNPAGSGLGLSIVARIVEAHGGRLWLDSEEGAGTACHLTLPYQPSTTARDNGLVAR